MDPETRAAGWPQHPGSENSEGGAEMRRGGGLSAPLPGQGAGVQGGGERKGRPAGERLGPARERAKAYNAGRTGRKKVSFRGKRKERADGRRGLGRADQPPTAGSTVLEPEKQVYEP